ncbi:class-III pyridoxal-phosphate-dependent aminotransferase [Tunturibacter empetritectus]|uniref:4-aminobutyrate aminotransferase-like enzyme n=1 Tax=Tunturiibacter empetritectus TaxID=3069691 RepID=A0A7W8II14_9BACT|nr:aspartate aminotransferase family protein [Edaphobacter lichenicola]MBB5316680.1 4-aminobutyrate aminotransferase-like enzyme [Edaphobacter lichenicola]
MPLWKNRGVNQFEFVSGEGAHLYDGSGRRFLDLTSGWNVANVGWQNRRLLEAFTNQAQQLSFSPSWCWHELRNRLAISLKRYFPMDVDVIGACTGAEAIENALKIARRYSGRHTIVGFRETYHGSTLGALQAGGVPSFRGVDIPQNDLHRFLPLPEPHITEEELGEAISDCVTRKPYPAAILIEPLFSNPGVIEGQPHFFEVLQKAARSVDALIIVDEVGTGFGRTGRMFAFEHLGINPDIVALGKAMGGAVAPISAAIARKPLGDVCKGLAFDSSYAWNPPSCAVALENIQILEDESLIARAHDLGEKIKLQFEQSTGNFGESVGLFGRGLEMAIRLPAGPTGNENLRLLMAQLADENIFAERSRYTNSLLLMPPLTIAETDLDSAIAQIVRILGERKPY